MNEKESMKKAYRIAQELLNDRLKEKEPGIFRGSSNRSKRPM
jgi:hypothetical protein